LQRAPAFVPTFTRVFHLNHKQHCRDLDQYIDYGSKRRPEIEADEADGRGYRDSKQFNVLISAEGQATLWDSFAPRFNQYASAELENT